MNSIKQTYYEALKQYQSGGKYPLIELCYKGPNNNYISSIVYSSIKNLFPLVKALFIEKNQFILFDELYKEHGEELCHQVFEEILDKSTAFITARTKDPAAYLYTCFYNSVLKLHRNRFPVSAYLWEKINDVLNKDSRFKKIGKIQDQLYQLSKWETDLPLHLEDAQELYPKIPDSSIKVIRRELPNEKIRFETNSVLISDAVHNLFEIVESALSIWQIHAIVLSHSTEQDAKIEFVSADHNENEEENVFEFIDPESININLNESQLKIDNVNIPLPNETPETIGNIANDFINNLDEEEQRIIFWFLTDQLSVSSAKDIFSDLIRSFIESSGNPREHSQEFTDYQWIGSKVRLSKNTVRNRLEIGNALLSKLDLLTRLNFKDNELLELTMVIYHRLGNRFGFF